MVALCNAIGTISTLGDLSKRYDASVATPKSLTVVRTLTALKFADSINIDVVSSETELCLPPIIPASAIGFSASEIVSIDDDNSKFSSFKASIFSSSLALLILISELVNLLKSKACNGCPNSNITKLVTSTTLLIELCPDFNNASTNHFGELPTFNPSTMVAEYLAHRSVSRILMLTLS